MNTTQPPFRLRLSYNDDGGARPIGYLWFSYYTTTYGAHLEYWDGAHWMPVPVAWPPGHPPSVPGEGCS